MAMAHAYVSFFLFLYFKCYQSFTVASYNTYQPSNPSLNPLTTTQISEIAAADFDVLCVQELTDIKKQQRYKSELNTTYPYSFGEIDVYDLTSSRTPCDGTESVALFDSTGCIATNCLSSTADGPEAFGICVFRQCQQQAFQLLHTECFYCMGFLTMVMPLENAINICSTADPLGMIFDLLSGTVVFSKYPIINSWHIDIPSWFGVERAVTLTEIDVCDVTLSGMECTDTIIFGCLHLKDTDMVDTEATFVPVTQKQVNKGITSHVGLNAYQAQWILNNILAPNVAPWQIDGDDNNVLQVIMAGDFNVGELLYSENLEIWTENEFVNGRYIYEIGSVDEGGTYNANLTDETPNALANEESVDNNWVLFNRDLDHILVYNGGGYSMERGINQEPNLVPCMNAASFNREFKELFDDDGTNTPLSDHWGVSLKFEYNTVLGSSLSCPTKSPTKSPTKAPTCTRYWTSCKCSYTWMGCPSWVDVYTGNKRRGSCGVCYLGGRYFGRKYNKYQYECETYCNDPFSFSRKEGINNHHIDGVNYENETHSLNDVMIGVLSGVLIAVVLTIYILIMFVVLTKKKKKERFNKN